MCGNPEIHSIFYYSKKAISVIVFLSTISIITGCHSSRKIVRTPPKKNPDQGILDKYSTIIGESVSNAKLYKSIDLYMYTPYKYGGKDLSGIDCSGLVAVIYRDALGQHIEGSSNSIYQKSSSVKSGQLYEGDLVFFKIKSTKVSHIGIYLTNRKFVHATTSKGVIISSLDENYYKTYFIGGGRVE
jgi:cell wall-associated NlpC family hydrolase